MKTVIYSRPEISHNEEDLRRLFEILADNGFDCYLNDGFAALVNEMGILSFAENKTYTSPSDFPESAEMIISYGGDGTFLDSVRLLNTKPVPVLGVNSGRMGFLANVSRHNEEPALKEVAQGRFGTEERMLLRIEGDFGCEIDYPYAFNEVSIEKSGVTTISVDVHINGELVTSYLGDGLIISTPAGSTAYSLSVGGPIVAPSSDCFVIAPIASHNLTMRPLVVPASSELRLSVNSRSGKAVVTMDNRDYTVDSGSGFTVTKAEKKVFLIKLQNISFYRTLREKMMWGMDTREFAK